MTCSVCQKAADRGRLEPTATTTTSKSRIQMLTDGPKMVDCLPGVSGHFRIWRGVHVSGMVWTFLDGSGCLPVKKPAELRERHMDCQPNMSYSFVWALWGIYFNNPTFTLKLVDTHGFFKLFTHCQELSLPFLLKCACSEMIYCRVNWPGSECRWYTFKLKTKARCLWVLVVILTSVNAVIENCFVSVNPVIYFHPTAALYAHSETRGPSLYT